MNKWPYSANYTIKNNKKIKNKINTMINKSKNFKSPIDKS